MSTTKHDDVTESKKRSRVEDDTELPPEKQPKRKEGASPSSPSLPSTPIIVQEEVGVDGPSPQLAFTIESADFIGKPKRKISVLRFEVEAKKIALRKRFAKDNEALFDEPGDGAVGWRRNDHFIFCPQEEPYEPAADALLATSAHPVEQAWMTEKKIRVGDVWHDTSKLCDVKCVHIFFPRSFAIQVVVIDGPVTLNMLIQAVEQALDTPLAHPQVQEVYKPAEEEYDDDEDEEEKPVTIGHLLRQSVMLDTENLTNGLPRSYVDVQFTRDGTETSFELQTFV
jgi:hypothetical protein